MPPDHVGAGPSTWTGKYARPKRYSSTSRDAPSRPEHPENCVVYPGAHALAKPPALAANRGCSPRLPCAEGLQWQPGLSDFTGSASVMDAARPPAGEEPAGQWNSHNCERRMSEREHLPPAGPAPVSSRNQLYTSCGRCCRPLVIRTSCKQTLGRSKHYTTETFLENVDKDSRLYFLELRTARFVRFSAYEDACARDGDAAGSSCPDTMDALGGSL